MSIRMVSALVALIAGIGAGAASAQQQTVARLIGVEGNVLVSQGDAMVAASNNQRVAIDTRIVTTAQSKATVSYDDGCNVPLKENERFTVRIGECAALIAAVVPLGPAPGAIGGGVGTAAAAGGASTMAALGVVGLVVPLGIGAYQVFRSSTPSSHN